MRSWPLLLALSLTLSGCWTQAPAPYESTERGVSHVPHRYRADAERTFGHIMRLAHDMPEWQTLSELRHDGGWLATFQVDTDPLRGHDEVKLRVVPDGPGVSVVSMWSRTRERSQDFGANDRRIEGFFRKLDASLPQVTEGGYVAEFPPPDAPRDPDPLPEDTLETGPDGTIRLAPVVPLEGAPAGPVVAEPLREAPITP